MPAIGKRRHFELVVINQHDRHLAVANCLVEFGENGAGMSQSGGNSLMFGSTIFTREP